MLKRTFVCIAALALASVTLGQNYAKRSLTINAATAIIDSDQVAGYPGNFAPHVWYNLDSNTRIKPAGYNFINPNRETQFTGPIVTRWTAIAGASPGAGTLTTKRHAPYWELRLSTATETQLGKLDVLLMAPRGFVSLNTVEREKLRRFIEKGGILWIDITSTTTFDPWNNFPFPFVSTNAVTGSGTFADTVNPLLSFPSTVSAADLYYMQSDPAVSQRDLDLNALGFGAVAGINEPSSSDTIRYSQVALDDKGAYISSASLGDGFIVVTTKGMATTLNREPNGAGGYLANTGATSENYQADRASDAAAKLVINMINLRASYPSTLQGSRKTGASPVDAGAPHLQESLVLQNMAGGSANAYHPPAVFKGLVAITTDTQLLVYDCDPKRDLDGDGDPDDGVRDYAQGASYDLVWASGAMPGPLSPPVGIEVPNVIAGISRDQIIVTDSAGAIHAFKAFPYNASGVLQGVPVPLYTVAPDTGAADYDLGSPDGGPYAPVFHEGYLINADSQNNGLGRSGRVWLANPATGKQVTSNGIGWSIGGSAASGAIPDTSFSPTVGYIPIADNSGGLDKVIYIPTRPNPSGGPQSTAGLTSLWLGVKGESPPANSIADAPLSLQIQTRASSQGLTVYKPNAANDDLGLGVRLTIIRPNGDAYTAADMDGTFTGQYSESNGVLTFVKKAGAPAFPVGFGVRVDYTIDYGTGVPGLSAQIVRGNINFADDTDRLRRVLHGVALSPKGTLHVVVSSQDPATKTGGTYYAIREEGRGNFKVVNRFDLYEQHVVTTNQATDITYPETLQNTDQILNYTPAFLAGRIQNQTFMSGPVVQDGAVYITGMGTRPFFGAIPYMFTMAFRAEPEVLRIQVGNLSNGFSVLQPDLARSTYSSGGRPDVFSVLQPNQYVYEQEDGADTGTIRIDNLSATTRGPLTNVLSTSQPIILRRNGQDDLLVEPSRGSGNWNQMLWYTVWMGTSSTSPMYASGRTLFIGATSAWAGIVLGVGLTPIGQVYAMDTQVAQNDKFLFSSDPNRPWFKQLYQILGTGGFANIDVNPVFEWPQVQGITSFNEYSTRLQQTSLRIPGGLPPFAAKTNGVVGGNGTIFAWADQGLWGFRKASFLVADEGRVARFDSIGTPEWMMTGTYRSGNQGDIGGAAEVRPLVRPTRAYADGDHGVVIVDTGANKIIRADVSGREQRTITDMRLDATYRPDGFSTQESLTLNAPRDVITFSTIVAAANNPFSNPQPLEYWNHYVIADAGNNRLIELVDRYTYQNNQLGAIVNDANGKNGIGVLYWHSPSTVSGAGYSYTSLARTFIDDGANSRWVYAAGIGNLLPTRADLGSDTPATAGDRKSDEGNGGIVIIDGANTQVINHVAVPAIAANVYWDDNTATFNSAAIPARDKKISSLNSVSIRTRLNGGGASEIVVMFTDSEGVFEIAGTGSTWNAEWMLDRKTYSVMRRNGGVLSVTDNPLDFRPTYAKRLSSGDVLVCNGYAGYYRRVNVTDPRVQFTGEVAMIDGSFDPAGTAFGFDWNKTNLGFDTLSIRAVLNNKPGGVRDARGIVGPVFADKQ